MQKSNLGGLNAGNLWGAGGEIKATFGNLAPGGYCTSKWSRRMSDMYIFEAEVNGKLGSCPRTLEPH